MSQFEDVQAFVREANLATRREELQGSLDGVTRELGFDYFALIQHFDVRATPLSEVVRLFSYPQAWRRLILERDYLVDDPVMAACRTRATGFMWSALDKIITLTPRQREYLDLAGREGLGDGFAVPIHIPGEGGGSCSFAVRTGREPPQASMPAAHYVACFGYEAARRIHLRTLSARERGERGTPKLSTRQLDCMVLAARGRTDSQIAEQLGIHERTVHQHVEEAKRRYDVKSRTLLVVRALFDGQVTFADVFRAPH